MAGLARQVLRRLGFGLVSLSVIAAVTVVLLRWAPGRFGDEWRLDPALAAETVTAAARRAGLDRPPDAIARAWIGGALRGDFGRSLASGLPVRPLVIAAALNTLALTVPAVALAWCGALALVARARGRRPSGITGALLSLIQALPDVVLALALVRLALWTAWFPVGGQGTATSGGTANPVVLVRHAALPVVGLALSMMPLIVRHVSACLEPLAATGFTTAAEARGLPPGRIFWRHSLRAALPAIAPLAGLSLSSLLGASLMFEVVFAWPGIGLLLVDAVQARDVPIVLAGVFASAVLLIVANVMGDGLQWLSDPRLRP